MRVSMHVWGLRLDGTGCWMDGVNTPADMDWANIQFVPSRLSSTVAAAQFLPIDLLATGAIALRDAAAAEYGAASSGAGRWRRRWGLNRREEEMR